MTVSLVFRMESAERLNSEEIDKVEAFRTEGYFILIQSGVPQGSNLGPLLFGVD
jgi:hypothetical protein